MAGRRHVRQQSARAGVLSIPTKAGPSLHLMASKWRSQTQTIVTKWIHYTQDSALLFSDGQTLHTSSPYSPCDFLLSSLPPPPSTTQPPFFCQLCFLVLTLPLLNFQATWPTRNIVQPVLTTCPKGKQENLLQGSQFIPFVFSPFPQKKKKKKNPPKSRSQATWNKTSTNIQKEDIPNLRINVYWC